MKNNMIWIALLIGGFLFFQREKVTEKDPEDDLVPAHPDYPDYGNGYLAGGGQLYNQYSYPDDDRFARYLH